MQKNKSLKRKGFTVIRIREAPLEKITEYDLVVPSRPKLHPTVVATLRQIQYVIERQGEPISETSREDIHHYIGSGQLVATDEADKIIDELSNFNSGDKRQERVELLTEIFGNDSWKTANGHLVSVSLEDIRKRAQLLGELLENSMWLARRITGM